MRQFCVRLLTTVLLFALVFTLFCIPASADSSSERLIALTFDDGPSKQTITLLDGLAERGVQATFFIVGENAETYPDIVRRAYAEGHQIGNHTYNHPDLTSLSSANVTSQITRTNTILNQAIGYTLDYVVRPPYGSYNTSVLNAIGAPCFYWTVDTRDWENRNASAVYNNIISSATDGSVILMHDLYPTTVTGALNAVDTLLEQGYEFVTINELFRRRGIALEDAAIYFSAKGDTTLPAIAAPAVSVIEGNGGKLVSLSESNGAPVYYTLDGSNPTPANSTLYTEPIFLTEDTTIKAIAAYNFNGSCGSITEVTIPVAHTAAPTISLSEDQTEIIISAGEDCKIYYTIDGSMPTKDSPRYTKPLTAMPGTTYRAIAQAPDAMVSRMTQLTYSDLAHLFTDVQVNDWFYHDVDRAVDLGLFKGVSETEFDPHSGITRGMLVTVLYRMAGESESEYTMTFTDVKEEAYYRDAVAWAFSNGVVNGYDEHTFAPDRYISRQEICKMINNYIAYCGKEVVIEDTSEPEVSEEKLLENEETTAPEDVPEDEETTAPEDAPENEEAAAAEDVPENEEAKEFELTFTDKDLVADWALEDVKALTFAGIINGRTDGSFDPTGNATRAEAAAITLRLLDCIDTLPDAPEPEPEPEPTPEPKPEPTPDNSFGSDYFPFYQS